MHLTFLEEAGLTDDILSLCIYRGGTEAVAESYDCGQSIYRSLQPELF